MGKSLIVVESPAKAKTIKKYLGKNFEVKASVGHIKDLPKKEIGVDVEKDFEPVYQVIPGKKKYIDDIKKAAAAADVIYLAPDPDREGEAIAWHIASELKKEGKVIHRALFNEITKSAIIAAIENPLPLDENKYNAQQARRVLDRLVGYRISPLLWKKVRRGLSAGRVQSVAVRVVCERESEIRSFESVEYWTLDALLEGKVPPQISARLNKIDGKKAALADGEQTTKIVDELSAAEFVVAKVEKKSRKRNPAPPFITASLQQTANRKLGFSAKKTMTIAQQLYEGIELGAAGPVGLITYMRTDSVRMSNEAVTAARELIEKNYGKNYLPPKPRVFASKKKSQDAHEAIRPTSIDYSPDQIKKFLSRDQLRLYALIWNRFIACQMAPALFDQTGVDIKAGIYNFRATGQVEKFDGYLRAYRTDEEEEGADDIKEGLLPELSEGQKLKLNELKPEQHFTQPPPRYTEASLVKELEEKEIGRPSTYASILSNIQDRKYVDLIEKKFHPTELGMLVNGLLIESFPQILDIKFTADMERDLDKVEEGDLDWVKALRGFYGPFEEALAIAEKSMRDVKNEIIPSGLKCDKCDDGEMLIKHGRFGEFLACSNYPECKSTGDFTRNEKGEVVLLEEKPEDTTDEVCELCQKPMTIKKGRFGPFLACTGYPDCKNTKRIDGKGGGAKAEAVPTIDTGEKCDKCGEGSIVLKTARAGSRFYSCSRYPKCKNSRPFPVGIKCSREDCDGELVERSSRYGKVFYGCSKYPDCDYTVWKKPFPEVCPECGSKFLAESHTKKKGDMLLCPVEECKYERPMKEGEKNPIDDLGPKA